MNNEVIIFDTTLRDGEQSPGATLNTREKLEIARHLELLNVDVIEAGFPVSSPGDFEAVSLIAQEVRKPIVCGLARAVEKDIAAAAEAVKKAARPRVHVFLATSEIHRTFKLKKAKEEILRLAVQGVKLARGLVSDVEFSPEDASRTELDFLVEVVAAVIEAGAGTVNIPDTVGYAVPSRFHTVIKTLRERVPNIGNAVISVHCHNDLGLAVANSLAALEAGARQVECTVNGIGERAGNAALEEIVMAIRTRADHYGLTTKIDTRRIVPASRAVSKLTGLLVQRNKAIVGQNAFAHESGVHQDGVLKERTTYEIMRPEDVGLSRSTLVLGKHSGRHAFRERVAELGFTLDDQQLDAALGKFKALADKKKEVFDDDIEAVIEDMLEVVPEVFQLVTFHTTSGVHTVPTATVVLKRGDAEPVRDAAVGDGPVDAIYNAIDRITGLDGTLLDYNIHAVTKGKDALGEVTLHVRCGDQSATGKAVTTDILESSARAYLNAVNRILARQVRKCGNGATQ